MKKLKYDILLLIALLISFSITGCTRRDLIEGMDEVPFKIELDWGVYSKPSSTGYFFYDHRGSAPLFLEGTTEGFEGNIPPGIYRIVIFNTDPINAKHRNNGDFEDDCFIADVLQTRSMPNAIGSVRNAYGAGLSNVVIPRFANEPIVQKAIPIELVRRINYTVDVGSIDGIESLELFQGGAIIDKCIVSNKPFTGNTATLYSETVKNEDNLFETQLSAFGFVGSCPLTATATFEDGTKASTIPIDMTEELIIYQADDKTIHLTLQLEDVGDINVAVKIHGWKTGGAGGTIIQ